MKERNKEVIGLGVGMRSRCVKAEGGAGGRRGEEGEGEGGKGQGGT